MRLRSFMAALIILAASVFSAASNKQDFIDLVRPFADEASKTSGISADFMISQSALETGWGKFVRVDINTGRSSNNFFNIKKKSTDDCDFVTIITHEYLTPQELKHVRSIGKKVVIEGKSCGKLYCSVLDTFRAYPSPRESFVDYANYLSHSSRYRKAMEVKDSVPDFAVALMNAGYATNPNYAALIINIWKGIRRGGLTGTPDRNRRKPMARK